MVFISKMSLSNQTMAIKPIDWYQHAIRGKERKEMSVPASNKWLFEERKYFHYIVSKTAFSLFF